MFKIYLFSLQFESPEFNSENVFITQGLNHIIIIYRIIFNRGYCRVCTFENYAITDNFKT